MNLGEQAKPLAPPPLAGSARRQVSQVPPASGAGAQFSLGVSRERTRHPSAPTREFEVYGPEAAHIQAALQMGECYAAGADRHWLEPLVEVLFPSDIQKA